MQVKLVINQTNYKVVLISRGIFSSQKIGKRLKSLIKNHFWHFFYSWVKLLHRLIKICLIAVMIVIYRMSLTGKHAHR